MSFFFKTCVVRWHIRLIVPVQAQRLLSHEEESLFITHLFFEEKNILRYVTKVKFDRMPSWRENIRCEIHVFCIDSSSNINECDRFWLHASERDAIWRYVWTQGFKDLAWFYKFILWI